MSAMLYKYRNWDNSDHRKMLQSAEIFFTSPKHFNDPFDCKIPINFFDLSEAVVERMARSVHKDSDTGTSRIEAAFYADDVVRKYKKRKKSEPAQAEFLTDFLKTHESRTGIFSMSAVRDNILMWSHYSASHSGFCVGFEVTLLHKAITDNLGQDMVFEVFKVFYRGNFPVVIVEGSSDEYPDWNKAFTTKAEDWMYEKEYRIILNGGPDLAITVPKGVIREVLIGVNATDQTKEEVIDAVRNLDSQIKLYQARLEEGAFALAFDVIE